VKPTYPSLLVEREDCDAGTVQQLRNALAQGKSSPSLKAIEEFVLKTWHDAKPAREVFERAGYRPPERGVMASHAYSSLVVSIYAAATLPGRGSEHAALANFPSGGC
jgi:hypothetical protein